MGSHRFVILKLGTKWTSVFRIINGTKRDVKASIKKYLAKDASYTKVFLQKYSGRIDLWELEYMIHKSTTFFEPDRFNGFEVSFSKSDTVYWAMNQNISSEELLQFIKKTYFKYIK